MPFYTVHVPAQDQDRPAQSDRIIFVAEKFNVPAFLFGPVWMLVRRLWLAFAGWLLLAAILATIIVFAGLGPGSGFILFFALQVLVGLEANNLRRRALARRDFSPVDLVGADDLGKAEKAFFRRQEAGRLASATAMPSSSSALPTRGPRGSGPADQGIGLFMGGEAR